MQSSFVSFGQCSRMTGPPADRNFSTVAAALAVGFCISSSNSSPLSCSAYISAVIKLWTRYAVYRPTHATLAMLLLCWARVPRCT